MSAVPPELSARIQRRIDEIQTDGMANWLLRVCKEQMNALPLQANSVRLWALRADATVLSLDFESVARPFEEERSPVARYAVLFEAARRYPELAALEPARPEGVQRCDACQGSGWVADTKASCFTCLGLGWHVRHRPIAEWLARIDRGDRLELQAHGGTERLVAGRLAGHYAARGDGLAFWSSPAGPPGRHQLENHLMRFAVDFTGSYHFQKHVVARWEPNPTASADPFESADHSLRFSGTGSGGSYEVDIARQPDGRYTMTVTLHDDWDPLGGAAPTAETTVLDEPAARAQVEREMRGSGRWNPFPAVVPRDQRETGDEP